MHGLMRVLSVASMLLMPAASLGADLDPAGHWEGKIAIGTHELAIAVDLDRNTAGAWVGSMSVAMSSSSDVPLGNITVEKAVVRFTATIPGMVSFAGSLSPDGAALTGSASNDEGSAPFQLARRGAAAVKVPPPSSILTRNFEGSWEATIDAGGKSVRLGLVLAPAADGTAQGTLASIDQGNQQFPVSTVRIADMQLELESRAISGKYVGTLGANGEIAGEWSQGQKHVPLTFRRASAPVAK